MKTLQNFYNSYDIGMHATLFENGLLVTSYDAGKSIVSSAHITSCQGQYKGILADATAWTRQYHPELYLDDDDEYESDTSCVVKHALIRAKQLDGRATFCINKDVESYVHDSDVWLNVTDEQGDWDDVTKYVNSNRTATITFVCNSYFVVELTNLKD